MENIEFKKNKKPETEEEIKADIRKSLELSPSFEDMTPEEQKELIDETYNDPYKKNQVKPEEKESAV
jgi:hypothetical protein